MISHIFFFFLIRLNRKNNGIKIETSANTKTIKATKTSSKENVNKSKKDGKNHGNNREDPTKFEVYFNFQVYANNIQAHQVLAINRGENLKVIQIPINLICLLNNKKKNIFIEVFNSESEHSRTHSVRNLQINSNKILWKW